MRGAFYFREILSIQYRLLSLLSLLTAIVTIAPAIARADTGNQGAWGDQGDGTFINPILPGDYSDIDASRVGDDYYAISSTLHPMVWKEKKPIAGFPILPPQTSDEFDARSLGMQWEWNHQPRAEKWSLSQRPGFLRLHAFKPLKKGDLLQAGNTLSQRSLRAQNNQVIVKLDLTGMADGQQAGLCDFARTYGTLGVVQSDGKCTLVFSDNGKSTPGPAIAGDALWLKSTWDQDGVSRYAYSLDGERFTALGQPHQLTWGHYRGDRVGVYCFNDESDAGHVDVD